MLLAIDEFYVKMLWPNPVTLEISVNDLLMAASASILETRDRREWRHLAHHRRQWRRGMPG
jgi:hypothetical protein